MKTQADPFLAAYIQTALWSSTDESGEPLDRDHDESDLAPATLATMESDCTDFMADNAADLEIVSAQIDSFRAGHCFWLNRNGHGSGFWDEYFGKDAELRAAFLRLSDASKAWGSCDLYAGDDGLIYC